MMKSSSLAALREILARMIDPQWFGPLDPRGFHPLDNHPKQHERYQGAAYAKADAMIVGPLAPILEGITPETEAAFLSGIERKGDTKMSTPETAAP